MKGELNQSIFKQEKMLNEMAELKNDNLIKKEEIIKINNELNNVARGDSYNKENINRLKMDFNEKTEVFNKFCNKIYNTTSEAIDKLKNCKSNVYSEHLYTSIFSDNIVRTIIESF